MMTLSMQRKFTFNSLLEDIRGSWCCVIKVRQYMSLVVRKLVFRIFDQVRPQQVCSATETSYTGVDKQKSSA